MEFTKDPKVELYGESKAEERIHLDLKFPDNENKSHYNVKVTVYNTNCTMSIDTTGKGKKDINNQTSAEYFVDNVILESVSILSKRYDVSKIIENYRKLAVLGSEKIKKGFHQCIQCKKAFTQKAV